MNIGINISTLLTIIFIINIATSIILDIIIGWNSVFGLNVMNKK